MPGPDKDRRRRRLAGLETSLQVLLAAALIGTAPPALSAEAAGLSGIVKDSLGNLLPDVEVLVLVPSQTTTPVATVSSDGQGQFRVAELLPGRYKLAAVKQGYLTFVGQVNTAVQKTIALVLHPAAARADEIPGAVPAHDSWALRVPRRGILHEVEAGPGPEAANASERPPVPRGARDSMTMQIDQLFAVGPPGSSDETESPELDSMETRMMLASALGDHGNIRVQGLRSSLGSDSGEGAPSKASHTSSSMQVNVSYEPSGGDQVAFNAYFSRQDFELSGDPTAVSNLEQEHRSWGYDASWSRQLDRKNYISVQLDYRDTSFAAPADGAADLLAAGQRAEPFSNRAVGARASYRLRQSDDHEVHIALRAQLSQWPTRLLATAGFSPAAEPGEEPSQWSLQLEAEDRWSASRAFSLIYGLGYQQTLAAGGSSLFIPRLGAQWQTTRLRLQGIVNYHRLAERTDLAARSAGTFGTRSPVGYDALAEIFIADGIRLQGGSSYTPILLDSFGFAEVDASEAPLWVSDGNTSVFHNRVALLEDRGSNQTYLELAGGRAEGTLAPLLPFEEPFYSVSERDLLYHNARFGMRFPSRGTDFSLRYEWVSATVEAEQPEDSIQESVEVRVRQNISGINLPGDWRVLVALRVGSLASGMVQDWEKNGGDGESLAALNRRIGAGVSVLF